MKCVEKFNSIYKKEPQNGEKAPPSPHWMMPEKYEKMKKSLYIDNISFQVRMQGISQKLHISP